jgi:hypothetical protein
MIQALVLAAAVPAHTPMVQPRPFELRHGVLVDPARAAVYLGRPKGGVEAVDLSSGRSLWATDGAALPLGLSGRALAAQGEEPKPGPRLPLVVLDVTAGGRKTLEATLPLPADVHALVTNELGRSFHATAEPDDGGLRVAWSYKETRVSGMAPPRGERPPTRTLSGAARVDLATGRVDPAEPSKRPVESPAAAKPARWRAGAVLAAAEGGRGGPLTLKRWDAETGRPLPDRLLLEKALVVLPSADAQHLLASEPIENGYRWSIFSLATGERVGESRQAVSAAPFFVWKDVIVFVSQPYGWRSGEKWIEEPLKARAVRLSSGDPVWDREIRDLEYRGTTPPAVPGVSRE